MWLSHWQSLRGSRSSETAEANQRLATNVPPEYPSENIEPEIERLLTIPRIVMPSKDTWEGYIKPADIADMGTASPLQQKLLLFASALEQQVDLLLNSAQLQNSQMRQLEAGMIRARLEREREAEADRGLKNLWRFLKWAGLLAGAAVVAFAVKKWLGINFP